MSAPPTPRRLPRTSIVAAILDAAASRFATRGYEATTMQEVAAAVGMTAPALYYYFESKQRLLYEVIVTNLRRFLEEITGAVTVEASPPAQLRAFVRAHVSFQLQHAAPARLYNAMFLGTAVLFDSLDARQRGTIRRLQASVVQRLQSILERGRRAGDFDVSDITVAERTIVAIGEFAPSWFRPGGALTAHDVAAECAEYALRMVAPVARPARSSRQRTLRR